MSGSAPAALHNSYRAKLTPEVIAVLVERRKAGVGLDDLAAEFGVSKGTLSRLFSGRSFGGAGRTELHRTRDVLTPKDIRKAVRLRRRGLRLKDIAAELGVSVGAVGRLLAGESFGGVGKVDLGVDRQRAFGFWAKGPVAVRRRLKGHTPKVNVATNSKHLVVKPLDGQASFLDGV